MEQELPGVGKTFSGKDLKIFVSVMGPKVVARIDLLNIVFFRADPGHFLKKWPINMMVRHLGIHRKTIPKENVLGEFTAIASLNAAANKDIVQQLVSQGDGLMINRQDHVPRSVRQIAYLASLNS